MIAARRTNTNHLQRNLFRVLEIVRENPQIGYDEIAAQLNISRSTAVQIVYMLEQQRRIVRLNWGSFRHP